MIQNVSMIGTPSTRAATATFAGAEDREHGQRVADEHDAARAGEDRRRMEVPAQEAGEGAGEHEAEHRHVRLDRVGGQADDAQGERRDQAMPDESPSRPSMKLMLLIMPTIQSKVTTAAMAPGITGCRSGKRVVDGGHGYAEGHGHAGQQELPEELPAGAELEPVVEKADPYGEYRSTQQCQDLRPFDYLRLIDEVHADDAVREYQRHRHDHEAQHDGDSAAPSYGLLVDPPGLGPIDHPEATGIAADDRRRRQSDRSRQAHERAAG